MTYGKDKIRDMTESLLPSTHRKGARDDRRNIHKKNRRRVNTDLNQYEDDYLPIERRDLFEDNHTDIRYVMYDRRNGDKVAPFIRWATAITAHLNDPEDRYNYVKRLVPDNLIGRHALTHIEFMEEFRFGPDRYARYRLKPHPPEPDWALLLRSIIENGYLKQFNVELKKLQCGHVGLRMTCDCNPRVLLGLHDIEMFLKENRKASGWKDITHKFNG